MEDKAKYVPYDHKLAQRFVARDNRRDISIEPQERVYIPTDLGQWSGGSVTYLRLRYLSGDEASGHTLVPGSSMDICQGQVMVRSGQFQGRTLPYQLIINPLDMDKFFSKGCQIHDECRANPEVGAVCESAGDNLLSDKFRHILYCYKGLKSGPYRKQALDRCGATAEDLERLMTSGFLLRKGNGIQITVAGKNEAKEMRGY